MVTTVDNGFRDFLARLTATPTQSDAVKSHRASIEACLKEHYGLQNFFRSGSFGNGTSIRNYSDTDYFASIGPDYQRPKSDNMLRAVRDTLDTRFPRTGVRVCTPAVLVPFGNTIAESTEVIPGYYVGLHENEHKIYKIAGGDGGWVRSSPSAHNAYVKAIDDKFDGKVKALIRFIKAWKYMRNVPVLSFYLEMRVAKYASGETSIVYSYDVKRILKQLLDLELASMQDPVGISGYIEPCGSETHKADALSKLETAVKRAEKALEEAKADKAKAAFEQWDLVFDGNFPAYG